MTNGALVFPGFKHNTPRPFDGAARIGDAIECTASRQRIQSKSLALIALRSQRALSRMRTSCQRSVGLKELADLDDESCFWGAVHVLIAKSQIQFSVIPYFISSIARQA
jgi:hypothetical protein